jgi:hypothetical protein
MVRVRAPPRVVIPVLVRRPIDAYLARPRPGRLAAWSARLVVGTCFAATVVFAGPRALAVVRARAAAVERSVPQGPRVALDRALVLEAPPWLRADLLTAVALDLAPVLNGEVGLTDAEGAARLLRRLRAVPWVRDAALQRVYPDRMRAALTLRQPAALLRAGTQVQLVDGDGVCLPGACALDLPEIEAGHPQAGVPGEPHPDPAVRAAAAIAAEWAHEIAPRVDDAPALRRLDVTNVGYRANPSRWCETRVGLARTGGGLAWLEYDHAPGSAAPRVPAATKVAVLRGLLAAYPGLAGVEHADLRFKNRWQDWVAAVRP